jgi:drug/metabolite transporter (DMT)-like permease
VIDFVRRAGRWADGQATLLLLATMLMWAGNAVAGRLAVGEISPMVLVCLRWMIVCVFLGIVARRRLIEDWPELKRNWPMVVVMGATGYTAFNAMFYAAAHHTSGVNMTILQGSIPVFTLIGAFVAFRTPVTGVQVLGMAVTLFGVLVIGTKGHPEALSELRFNIGDVWLVTACILYAAYTVALRKRPKASGLGFFAAMAMVAFVTSIPMLAAEGLRGEIVWPTPKGWVIMLYVAIFPSFLAQIFFMRGVEIIGPGRAALFANLVPAFGAIMAVLILDEVFETFHAVSLVLVLGGIYIAERLGKR